MLDDHCPTIGFVVIVCVVFIAAFWGLHAESEGAKELAQTCMRTGGKPVMEGNRFKTCEVRP